MDVPAAWTPHGKPITVKLKTPCVSCGYHGDVVTQPIVKKNLRKLPTKCPGCGLRFELGIKAYGAAAGWSATRSGTRRRGRSWQPQDHQLFARYDWCCVYHEGSVEAAHFRRAQLEQLGIAVTASALDSPVQGSLFASAQELVAPSQVDPNLFGLVPDHVIPKSIQELLDDRWTPQHRNLMQRAWIVAACGRCNGQRNQELETSQKLLYIFSRFVLPHRAGSEIDRLRETFLFVEVLEAIERYRLATGSDEPLRPLRLARKLDSDTASAEESSR